MELGVWIVFLFKACPLGETGDAARKREAEAQSEKASHLKVRWTWPAGVGPLEEDHRLPAETTGTVPGDLVLLLWNSSFMRNCCWKALKLLLMSSAQTHSLSSLHGWPMTVGPGSNDALCLSPPAELLCQKLLQHADAGTFCRLCHQLYPPVL